MMRVLVVGYDTDAADFIATDSTLAVCLQRPYQRGCVAPNFSELSSCQLPQLTFTNERQSIRVSTM
jgi:hypothetical protein